MLNADLMIRTNDRTLKQAPYALDRISVNVAADPFFRMMVDCLMCRVCIGNSEVSRILIGHQALCLRMHCFLDKRMKYLLSGFLARFNSQTNQTAALDRAEHHRFVIQDAAANVTALSADVGFVNLNRSLERLRIGFFHGLTDAMAEIPRRF